MPHLHDHLPELVDAVRAAVAEGARLRVTGGGSTPLPAPAQEVRALSVLPHRGVVGYAPSELVLQVRAGTPLRDVETVLAEAGQALPFEPPAYGPEATIGGAVAFGQSGPARPWRGSVRDAVLGVQLINGRGECLRFGGQVMKNVAGYDLARLQAGACGAFGVITELSLKVLPRPASERTQVLEVDRDAALAQVVALQRSPAPVSATFQQLGRLWVRFAGADTAVHAAAAAFGGETLADDAATQFWADVREHRIEVLRGAAELWRFSLPPAAPFPALYGDGDAGASWSTEWAGAQRWLALPAGAEPLAPARAFAAAVAAGGFATRWRPRWLVPPPSDVRRALQARLKAAFDPHNVFDPGVP